jgi:hypothetical protein
VLVITNAAKAHSISERPADRSASRSNKRGHSATPPKPIDAIGAGFGNFFGMPIEARRVGQFCRPSRTKVLADAAIFKLDRRANRLQKGS